MAHDEKAAPEQLAWVLFLRETTRDACTADVQAAFDGCWDKGLDVDQWINEANRKRHLFEDPDVYVPTAFWSGMEGEIVDPKRQFSITFDMHATDEALKEAVIAFKRLFHQEEGVMIDKAWKPSPTGAFKLASRPDVSALMTALIVYREMRNNPSEDLYKIGYRLQMTHDIAAGWKKVSDGDDKQKAVANAVSKFNSWAKRLIKGVEQGTFPVQK